MFFAAKTKAIEVFPCFKTLFKEPKHIEIWKFIKVTFSDDFVTLVDEQIKQSEIYGTNSKQD